MKQYTIYYLSPASRIARGSWSPGVRCFGRADGEEKIRAMFEKNPRPLRLYSSDAFGNDLELILELGAVTAC